MSGLGLTFILAPYCGWSDGGCSFGYLYQNNINGSAHAFSVSCNGSTEYNDAWVNWFNWGPDSAIIQSMPDGVAEDCGMD